MVSPFKEEVERRGWKEVCRHLEQGRRALVKEFYTNIGNRKNLTYYVKGRWVLFGERVISQLFGLGQGGDYTQYEQLQKSPNFEEISKELIGG